MNEAELVFSEIEDNDLLECAALFAESFKQPPWDEKWNIDDALERLSDFYHCPKTVAFKVLDNGYIVGFLIGNVEVWCEDNYFYLKEMCVSSTRQRAGVGRILMTHLEEVLLEKKIARAYLMTQRNSIPEQFYTSLGYMVNHEMIVMRKWME